jgi:hypothetical protein
VQIGQISLFLVYGRQQQTVFSEEIPTIRFLSSWESKFMR